MVEGVKQAARLPVVFALHDPKGDYWLNTAVAMTSAVRHAKRPLDIRIIHDETVGETPRRRLAEVAAELGAPLTFVPWRMPVAVDPAILARFSPATLFRLAIPLLMPDDDIVVYLDSDLVVNGADVNDIADLTPADAALSAAVDPFIAAFPTQAAKIDGLGVAPEHYFNAGVLGLRPRLLPRDLIQRCAAFLVERPQTVHPDQDFLNHAFRGAYQPLPERCNFIIGVLGGRAMAKLTFYAGKVIHYASHIKPMTGVVCPAFIPFFAHAYLVPEIYMGGQYTATRYLFPAAPPNTVNAKYIGTVM